MRLWSIHPKYLDTKGLVALWRESLLAKSVLMGQTIGYKFHPQLNRFRSSEDPISSINQYLSEIYYESVNRNFKFNKQKVDCSFQHNKIPVNSGQVEYEMSHLLSKLKIRDKERYTLLINKQPEVHPIFNVVVGNIENWEVIMD